MRRLRLIWTACWVLLACDAAFGQTKRDDCVGGSVAAPEQVIAACDALLADTAMAETKLPAILLARAEALVRQERLKSAIDDLSRVVELRPDNALAFFRRAELHRTLGDADVAIADYSRTIRLEPKNVAALFARAELYRAKTDRRHALADYAAVLRLDPSHEAAAADYKALALEIERLGAMMPVR